MARPRKYTDEDILAAARDVFIEHGPGASTVLIADVLGMSQAALFKRFGTKEELMVQALLPPSHIGWIETLEAGPDARPIPDQLSEILAEAGRFFVYMLPALMTMKASGFDLACHLADQPMPPPLRARGAAAAFLQQAIDAGRMRPVLTDSVALAFIGAMQSRAAMTFIFGAPAPTDQDLVDHARGVIDAVWLGLAPKPLPTTTGET